MQKKQTEKLYSISQSNVLNVCIANLGKLKSSGDGRQGFDFSLVTSPAEYHDNGICPTAAGESYVGGGVPPPGA